MIVGLTGLKGSGKDTVAAYLIKEHGFERRAFADPLKKSVAALLDIPYHEIDKWKNDPTMTVEYGSGHMLTFREFLQRFGDEASKQVWGDTFWNDLTLPTDGYYAGRNIVITDCRFESDVRRITICGGYVVSVQRPGLSNKDPHRGEANLPPNLVDYQLMNDGDIQSLNERVETMLYQLTEEANETSRVISQGSHNG